MSHRQKVHMLTRSIKNEQSRSSCPKAIFGRGFWRVGAICHGPNGRDLFIAIVVNIPNLAYCTLKAPEIIDHVNHSGKEYNAAGFCFQYINISIYSWHGVK